MGKPERCPFLQGELWDRSFEGRKGERLDFQCQLRCVLFNPPSDFPEQHGCLNGKYLQCKDYAQRVLGLSMTVPTTCPLKKQDNDQCEATNKECDHYWIDLFTDPINGIDYRQCEVFSKWFWQQREAERL